MGKGNGSTRMSTKGSPKGLSATTTGGGRNIAGYSPFTPRDIESYSPLGYDREWARRYNEEIPKTERLLNRFYKTVNQTDLSKIDFVEDNLGGNRSWRATIEDSNGRLIGSLDIYERNNGYKAKIGAFNGSWTSYQADSDLGSNFKSLEAAKDGIKKALRSKNLKWGIGSKV